MLKINRKKCGYCGACVSVCNGGYLELMDVILEISNKCSSCGICVKACPVGALELLNEE